MARALRHPYYADEIDGLDLDKLASAGTEILRGHALVRQELGRRLVEHFPGRHPGRLADAVEIMEPLVHGPEAGEWGRWRHPATISLTIAEEWIGRPMAAARRESMIRRYLAGFGPLSTAADLLLVLALYNWWNRMVGACKTQVVAPV